MWVSVGKKMTRAQVEKELKPVTYTDTIQHYEKLRDLFLKQLSLLAGEEGKEHLRRELIEAVAEINKNPIEGQAELTKEMFESFKNMIVDRLSNNAAVKQGVKNLYSEEKISESKMKKKLEEASKELFSDTELKAWIETFLKDKYGENVKGFVLDDFLYSFRAYSRRVLNDSTNEREISNYRYYVNSAKGFAREALIYAAFFKAFEKVGQNIVEMEGAKRVKDEETGQNVQTAYDILISFTGNLESALEAVVTAEEDFSVDKAIFGIQSKSYHLESSNWGKSIGSRAELFKNYTAQTGFWSWIDGIKFLEKYADQVLGRHNVGYVTGDGFLFTSSFIRRMIQLHYYIAFVFDKGHHATSTVTWQQIQSD